MDKDLLRHLVVGYGEACHMQGKKVADYGHAHPDTEEATATRVAAFNKVVKALELAESKPAKTPETRPVVTTLCGSSRFPDLHMQVMMALTLQGRVVIPLGCYGHADVPTGARFLTSDGDESTPEKRRLDELHFRKIEMSDGIFVVNPGGYVGSSTIREVGHAKHLGKTVEYLFPERA